MLRKLYERFRRMTLARKLLVLFCLALLVLYGGSMYMKYEANTLIAQEVTVSHKALVPLNGLRILVFSDVHSNLDTLTQVADYAEQVKPDLVLFLGDLFTDFQRVSYAGKFIQQLKRLSAVAPAFAIYGNHDMALLHNVERVLKESGFSILRNSADFVTIPRLGNQEFKLVGLGDFREGDCFPDRCMVLRVGTDVDAIPTIVLNHNPLGRELTKNYRWDLMLSGHTHGGQVRLPFFNNPLLLRDGETMANGLYDDDGRPIFVSPGIGYIGPGRLNCPPQVNLITIAQKNDG